MARDIFGCRVLERLIEHFDAIPSAAQELDGLLLQTMGDSRTLCSLMCHGYGNFVVQHLIVHGSGDFKQRIRRALISNLDAVAVHIRGAAVLDAALTMLPQCRAFVRSYLDAKPELVCEMRCHRAGQAALRQLTACPKRSSARPRTLLLSPALSESVRTRCPVHVPLSLLGAARLALLGPHGAHFRDIELSTGANVWLEGSGTRQDPLQLCAGARTAAQLRLASVRICDLVRKLHLAIELQAI